MRQSVIAFVLIAALPAVAANMERKRLTVEAANDDYTPTGIMVKKGDLILIGARGEISTGPFAGKTQPDGHQGYCGQSDDDGALMYKVGTSGALKAGSHKTVIPDHEGELKFKVRDTKYSDNSGAFLVGVTHIGRDIEPKPKATELTVEVANDEWTPANVTVDKGDLLVIAAGPSPTMPVALRTARDGAPGTPDGIRCLGMRAVNFDNDGALMMKIGTGDYLRASSVGFIYANASGPVKFRVRLDRHEGNKGAYNLAVFKFAANTLPSDMAQNDK